VFEAAGQFGFPTGNGPHEVLNVFQNNELSLYTPKDWPALSVPPEHQGWLGSLLDPGPHTVELFESVWLMLLAANCVLLKMLKKSIVNFAVTLSVILKFLRTEKSVLAIPGP
jgi:hypothetical protein